MNPVQLGSITKAHFLGNWRLQSRILAGTDQNSHFAKASGFYFDDEGYSSDTVEKGKITWNFRHDEFLNNPLIEFKSEETTGLSAIVTRYLESVDDEHAQLTLYFSTGLELVLIR